MKTLAGEGKISFVSLNDPAGEGEFLSQDGRFFYHRVEITFFHAW